MRKSYMVFRIIIKGKWPNIIERKIEMGKKKKKTRDSAIMYPFDLILPFLIACLYCTNRVSGKKKKKNNESSRAKKSRKEEICLFHREKSSWHWIIFVISEEKRKKKKEKKNIMKNCQNCFRYFEKVSYYIIACIIMRK